MALRFESPSTFGGPTAALNNARTQAGPDLEEISTEAIGFQTIAGEAKLRLLPSSWPADNLPPSTASLLGVASRKGILAAVGPESVIIASTESVRQAYSATGVAEGNIKPFTPQLTLNIGMRVSQVAFSADEDFLILSAENGGGLAVYDVQSILQGGNQSTFELGTNGSSLRALAPNHTTERAELIALVTTKGELMMANLKTRQLLSGAQGQVLKDGVSCISWSPRGKRLIAGLGNGTSFQMTPQGELEGELPRPSPLEGDQHVSSISWLENDLFLVAHTPSSYDAGMSPVTSYGLITRSTGPQPEFMYQKLPEPCPPFGLDRSSPYQFMQRLKNFPPNLSDAIVVASTASTDIGLVTRSKTPLMANYPAERITNVFTTTSMADDSRRAQMPFTEELTDTSPIGVALDLSSKDKVKRPLPKEDFDESPVPLPALMVLNNEGILATWWIVYAESIRQGTAFPGLAIAGGSEGKQQPQAHRQLSPFAAPTSQPTSTFGQPGFGKSPTPGSFGDITANKPAASVFGSPSTSAPGVSAFGTSSGLGVKQSPWGTAATNSTIAPNTAPSFGQPAFGSSTPSGSSSQNVAFGMAGGIGNRISVWGGAPSGTAAASGSAFGKVGGLGMRASPFGTASTGSPFGSTATATNSLAPSSGGFASFAAKPSGFMAAGTSSTPSVFGKATTGASFGSGMDTDTPFGQSLKQDEAPKSVFGGGGGFTLGSTFKSDGTAANDAPKPTGNATSSMFGSGFGSALGETRTEASAPQTKDDEMDDDDNDTLAGNHEVTPVKKDITIPADTPAPPKLFPQTAPPAQGGLFGTQAQSQTSPAEVQSSKSTTLTFGKPTPTTSTPNEFPAKQEDRPRPSVETSPIIKVEPQSDDDDISPLNEEESAPPEGYDLAVEATAPRQYTPETAPPSESKSSEEPLPPLSTSKDTYAPGDSSNSSKASTDEGPLPPDLVPKNQSPKSKLKGDEAAPGKQTRLPSEGEDEELDDEGSGVDVAKEISQFTPESSFGTVPEKSPVADLFSKAQRPEDPPKGRPLFGEMIGKTSAPFLPPPGKVQTSPRSPSPVRSMITSDSLRPDTSRSVSAPGPFKALTHHRNKINQVTVPPKPHPSTAEIQRQEQERLIAERAKRTSEEEQDLSDREDEQVREELATEVASTKQLDTFLAHQDYIGSINKPGIPGQIEKVYRDINSMIDTLGLNARSLKAFTKGHTEMFKEGGRSREDLEDPDWCLGEIAELTQIESELSHQLATGCLQDVQDRLSTCRDLQKSLSSLRHQRADLTRAIETFTSPIHTSSALSAPLTLEQSTQQHSLRKKFMHFQQQLAQAEADTTMLRAKLASCEGPLNSKGAPPLRKPTVDAVTKTIMKMTSMIEQKSGDIDVLAAQMRGLRFGFVSAADWEASPKRQQATWDAHAVPPPPDRSVRGTPRKNAVADDTAGVTAAEVQNCRARAQRRREVNRVVREAYEWEGMRVRGLE